MIARPQKKTSESNVACAERVCNCIKEVLVSHKANLWRVVGLVLLVSLARVLRVAGFFGSLYHVVAAACFCGGCACLGFIWATSGMQQEQQQGCDCWCRQEETCQAGNKCPYHQDFWPSMPCVELKQETQQV